MFCFEGRIEGFYDGEGGSFVFVNGEINGLSLN